MKIFILALFTGLSISAGAQSTTVSAPKATLVTDTALAKKPDLPGLDKSPLDMCYFPAEFPMLKSQRRATSPVARVLYSRPSKGDRVIFGELVEYNKVWRLGANEATEIEFYKDVTIAGKKVPKGRYTLYAIPTETKWTIIINRDTDTWGAFVYDSKKDVARAEVPVKKLDAPVDLFSIAFDKTSKGCNLLIAWESASVSLPIEAK